ncbi:TIR domain-containing protein [Paenibacillus sp. IITD108]|uniref:TIR domain-containing protein n=1 Tax=Paenibacillus sp. IITD108 TaxID=3116649 RepID=UPI002F3F9E46
MTQHRKPRVFIGSSREAIDFARAVGTALEYVAEVNPWYAAAFNGNDYTMEALERELSTNDFAVFLFAADDVALIRGKPVFITRDNTIFEMGMFWGRLGRRRVYGIIPHNLASRDDLIHKTTVSEYHLLSDLTGLTMLRYNANRTDLKHAAAVDTACGEIMAAIAKEGLFVDPNVLLVRKQSILHFFWEYIRNSGAANQAQQYASYAEAIRFSFLAPRDFRVLGAAIWKREQDRIYQAGGNVGRERSFHMDENAGKKEGEQRIYMLDTFLSGEWSFFKRREIAEVCVLCYPLGKKHALSVHISGNRTLTDVQLAEIVEHNDELLNTMNYLIGGDSL